MKTVLYVIKDGKALTFSPPASAVNLEVVKRNFKMFLKQFPDFGDDFKCYIIADFDNETAKIEPYKNPVEVEL